MLLDIAITPHDHKLIVGVVNIGVTGDGGIAVVRLRLDVMIVAVDGKDAVKDGPSAIPAHGNAGPADMLPLVGPDLLDKAVSLEDAMSSPVDGLNTTNSTVGGKNLDGGVGAEDVVVGL